MLSYLTLFSALGPMFCFGTEIASMSSDIVTVQKSAPLQVVGVRMSLENLCEYVIAANVTEKTIVRVQLGSVLSEKRNGGASPAAIFQSPVLAVRIPPSDIAKIGPHVTKFQEMTSTLSNLGARRGVLLTGITYVQFSDGTEWSYPLTAKRAFEEIQDSELMNRVLPKLRQYRATTRASRQGSPSRTCGASAKTARQEAPKEGPLDALLHWMWPGTVHAQAGAWVFVCNPAPRDCEEEYAVHYGCTTYYCDPYNCNAQQCCLLNQNTGETRCN